MDTTGFNQVGRYGTLSLLKRRTSTALSSSPSDLITSFGIDESPLTFGSTSTCGVRLYYPDVDPLHCQLVFEDGKAFLSIFGKGGVYVDGCWVYPHSSSSENNQSMPDRGRQQTIIPISNNTEFEIHHKRFRFTYPPKEVRKTLLLASPAPAQKRALRLSMIHSAQVFSPRPSKDPRENLRILQSPLKPGIFGAGSPAKTPIRPRAVSPLKYSSKSGSSSDDEGQEEQQQQHNEQENEEEEEEIVLVHTNHPRVVEEDRDLVILEDVPMGPLPGVYSATGSPVQSLQAPAPLHAQPEQAVPPRTPRRKSLGGTALHRAVLIRSAQRAVWRAEKEKEEEEEREEEMEVLGAVVDPAEVGVEGDEEEDVYDYEEQGQEEDQDVVMRSASSEEYEDEELTDEEEDAEALAQKEANKSLWRKSLERIIPWPFGAPADAEEREDDTYDDDDENERTNDGYTDNKAGEELEEDENEMPAPLPVRPAQTPIRRALGSFMTPQAHNPLIGQAKRPIFPATSERSRASMAPPVLPGPTEAPPPATGPGRYSLGGGEARRVLVQQPWRVKDLVLPPGPAGAPSFAPTASSAMPPPATPTPAAAVAATTRATPAVTAEERRAIQERRRSAVREFKEDTFWKDGAPGMSPAKSVARMSVGTVSASARPTSTSPVKQGVHGMQLGTGDPDATNGASLAMPTPKRLVFGSPTKGRSLGYAIAEEGTVGEDSKLKDAEVEDEELDTRSLLDRMRETVDDMKRRRSAVANTPRVESIASAPTATIERSVLLRAPPMPAGTPTSVALASPEHERPEFSLGMGSVKKLDFTRITTPAMRAGSAKPASSSSSGLEAGEPDKATEPETTAEAVEEEPFSLLRSVPREVSPSRKSPSRSTRGTRRAAKGAEEQDEAVEDVRAVLLPAVVVEAVEEDAPSDAMEQEEQEKPKEPKGKAKGRSRLLRAPKPVVAEEEEVENDEEMVDVQEPSRSQGRSRAAAKPRSRSAKSPAPTSQSELEPTATLAPTTRRQRSKTPQPPLEDDHIEPVPRSTARRTRKGTAEPEEPAPTPVPARRGRKANTEPESEVEGATEDQEKKAKTPAAKRGRKPRVATVEEEPEEEAEAELPEPTPAAAPVKRGRPKKTAPSPAPEIHDLDEDELDSYEARPSSSKTKSSIPVKAPVKGRGKKAAAVKQESDEEHEEEAEAAPLATARGGRAVKANTTAITPAAPKTAVPATVPTKIGKPRGKLKTPASLPTAATSRVQVVPAVNADTAEKENTPGTSGTVVSDDAADDAPVKVRMSRRTGATAAAAGSGKTARTAVAKSATKSTTKGTVKSKVKVEEEQEEEEDAGRGRTTRVTRTRTKA